MLYKNIALGLSGKDGEAPVIKEACRIAVACDAEKIAINVNDPDAGETTRIKLLPE